MNVIENAIVSKEVLKDVVENIEHNKVILEYYRRLSTECGIMFSFDTMERVTTRLEDCNSVWFFDKYEQAKIKDFKKTLLCHDKFCANCKKVKQAMRMAKYSPQLEQYKDKLYHLTLTNPNVTGVELPYTIRNMARSYKKLIRYLNGDLKIKGIDFSSWGYEGAVRSLEITFNGDDYHPHYHTGLVMSPNLGKRNIENKFSFNYKNGIAELVRLFCKQEILIQKIWYLLINGQKVTKKAIDELELGYSCTLVQFQEDDYAELFKYMTKASDQSGHTLSYENFVILYHSLYRVKQIQGYGVLYQLSNDEDFEVYELAYEEFIQDCLQKEKPMRSNQKPQALILDTEYTLISRKSYYKFLNDIIAHAPVDEN